MNAKWEDVLPIAGTVLIVEDDPTLCALMGHIFADMGTESIVYASADEAFAYLVQNHAHC